MQQQLNRVADNLYRSESSSVYYAIFFRDGKQIKRSLKTTDPGSQQTIFGFLIVSGGHDLFRVFDLVIQ